MVKEPFANGIRKLLSSKGFAKPTILLISEAIVTRLFTKPKNHSFVANFIVLFQQALFRMLTRLLKLLTDLSESKENLEVS